MAGNRWNGRNGRNRRWRPWRKTRKTRTTAAAAAAAGAAAGFETSTCGIVQADSDGCCQTPTQVWVKGESRCG